MNLDMKIQSLFYQNNAWIFKESQPWNLLYHYGNIPALILSVGSLFLFLASFYSYRFLRYRKIAIFLVLAMVIGPGFITNTVLKDNWGRPRPRNVIEFGGKYEFEQVLTRDSTSPGKSFPCGHATMGFYGFALYFLFRNRKPKLATFFLGLAIFYGGLIGAARLVQGGHFFSDVVWAGVLIYLTSAWLFYGLKLQQSLFFQHDKILVSQRMKITALVFFLVIILTGFVFVATPYEKDFNFSIETSLHQPVNYYFELENAEVTISTDTLFAISANAFGHGFPGSKAKMILQTNEMSDSLHFYQQVTGLFSEFSCELNVRLPDSLLIEIELHVKKGNVVMNDMNNVFIFTKSESDIQNELWQKVENGYSIGNVERKIVTITNSQLILK